VDRLPSQVSSIAISDDGAWLAEGATDGAVRLTDLRSGAHRDLGRHKNMVRALAFSSTGLLASGCLDHTFRIWRLDDGSFRSFDASGGGVLKLAFSRDAKTLFLFNINESLLRRWSVDSGEALAPFTGHTAPLRSFIFSGDGRRILTHSLDTTARIYDAETGKSRALSGHKDFLAGAAFAAGGKLIITLGSEGTVRAWPDDLPETMPELREWLLAATPDTVEKR
jgi:WD40 repeat protein